jgi:4,5-DOPA dioxygenase extradiol
MRRRDFLPAFVTAGFGFSLLRNLAQAADAPQTMPVLFMGHGSPMNAIETNSFSRTWLEMGKKITPPRLILCISAHWETRGTFITAMEKPKTIHDFGGFPQALFDAQYPAPGAPAFAKELAATKSNLQLDHEWGLDHGAWSILKQMFPAANIPVVQLSLDYTQGPAFHYQLGKELAHLRKKGVLIIGSGNMIHNLGMLNWNQPDSGFDWARQLNQKLKTAIADGQHTALQQYQKLDPAMKLAAPSPEHYLPLLYILGLQAKNENPRFFNDSLQMGSISMTSVAFGM